MRSSRSNAYISPGRSMSSSEEPALKHASYLTSTYTLSIVDVQVSFGKVMIEDQLRVSPSFILRLASPESIRVCTGGAAFCDLFIQGSQSHLWSMLHVQTARLEPQPLKWRVTAKQFDHFQVCSSVTLGHPRRVHVPVIDFRIRYYQKPPAHTAPADESSILCMAGKVPLDRRGSTEDRSPPPRSHRSLKAVYGNNQRILPPYGTRPTVMHCAHTADSGFNLSV